MSVEIQNAQLPLAGFEGAEKLLEIWFDVSDSQSSRGLRSVDPSIWHDMLRLVQCQVLSTINNDSCDAYLLSESSMFVYNNRLILKTCGTTTLLHSVSRILQIALDQCNLSKVDALFYSRKSFLYPEQQSFPHGSWNDEVGYLDHIFPRVQFDTAAYVIGKTNGDHWCLYFATPLALDKDGIPIATREVDEVCNVRDDVTLEILMHDLDQDTMKAFWRTDDEKMQAKLPHNVDARKHQFLNPRRLYNETGIADIYPESIVDDYVFDPCGYSANGLLGNYYYTYHITPESHCSYASFETTIPLAALNPESNYTAYNQVIQKVIDVFKPARFSTVIVRRNYEDSEPYVAEPSLPGFKHRERISHSLGKWEVCVSMFEKRTKFQIR